MPLYRFDVFQLDPHARRLLRDGHEVAIEPRVFDVIVYLVEQRERAVGRDELIAAAWGRVDSSDATLAQAILKARRLLGDDGQAQRTIRTVARFGYQWVAATQHDRNPRDTDATPTSEPARSNVAEHVDMHRPATPARRRATPFALTIAATLLLAALATGMYFRRGQVSETHPDSAIPGLVAVLPAQIHSAVAQDGWMRLGLMAMGADALRALPQHAVVPSETVLAALGRSGDDTNAARVRTATGATTIVRIDGRREHSLWLLEATIDSASGAPTTISAEAGDAVAAAAALGERLRLAIGSGSHSESSDAPETLALAAHIQADLLDGKAAHALELAAAAEPRDAASPRLRLLRAKAMNRLGHAAEAAADIRSLIGQTHDAATPWLSEAWTTLGYSELVGGQRDAAEQAFRSAIAALGDNRVEIGRAWRGLGNAQAAREDYDDAEASYLRARMELQGSGDRLLLAHLLDDLGTVATRRGRFDEAIERYGEAATAAAALGSGEIELGARMNVALAQQERLKHAAALASWQALLPRIRAVEYPSMRRFAAIHYADALAETGALTQAAATLQAEPGADERGNHDALEDARLDVLHIQLMLGDTRDVVNGARAIRAAGDATPNRRVAAGALELDAALAGADADAARDAQTALATLLPDAQGVARARGLLALAGAQAAQGIAADADTTFREALAVVRTTGSPRDLRDVAVPYATFQLSRGELDAARATASLVDPYADDDFPISLLLARVAMASHDDDAAKRLHAQAKALAGARWTASTSGEAGSPRLVDVSSPDGER